MAPKHMFLLSCLVILATLHGIHVVELEVINNAESSAGGIRFTNEIGTEHNMLVLSVSTYFIHFIFNQQFIYIYINITIPHLVKIKHQPL